MGINATHSCAQVETSRRKTLNPRPPRRSVQRGAAQQSAWGRWLSNSPLTQPLTCTTNTESRNNELRVSTAIDHTAERAAGDAVGSLGMCVVTM